MSAEGELASLDSSLPKETGLINPQPEDLEWSMNELHESEAKLQLHSCADFPNIKDEN